MTNSEKTAEALRSGIAAASQLGLDTTAAETTARLIEDRSGFPGSTYVIALAGGTGVGKSSLLNALAGSQVSEVRVIRPTTSRPRAWAHSDDLAEVKPLLDWIGVDQVVGHRNHDLANIAIVDLPDIDSVKLEHRATVDALIPRIDALYWVLDPEKYDDERAHHYLRALAPHSERMVFLLNKADRLSVAQQRLLAEDLERRLSMDGIARAAIVPVSAQSGQGIGAWRARLAADADHKALVSAKLATDAKIALERLAAQVGATGEIPPSPLLDEGVRDEAREAAVKGALAVVDPAGLSRQVEAAALNRARRQGGSLLVRILAMLSTLTGTRRRTADPEGYLLSWQQRGSLGHIANPVRRAVVDALGRLPAGGRSPAIAALGFEALEERLVKAIDQATRESRVEARPPRSSLWLVIGVLQLAVGAVFLFAVAWYLTLIFGPGGIEVATVEVAYLGPVPMPLVLIVSSMVVSFVLGVLLKIHAASVGRRQGRRVAMRVREAIEETLSQAAFAPLDRLEEARLRLYEARSQL